MPTDAEIEFGRRAVAAGDLTQSQLDDAIMLLHDLERAGSRRRLWDIVTSKGYMTAERAAALRAAVGAHAPGGEPAATHAPEARVGSGEPVVGEFLLVQIRLAEAPRFHYILKRPMTIGTDPQADIVLDEPGVEGRHARLTWGDRGPTIWDVGARLGVVVNHRRTTSCLLAPGDLIRLGETLLLLISAGESARVVEPTTPALVGGEPLACLRTVAGAREGEVFYIGARPLLIGHGTPCTVRLPDAGVAEFHAHLSVNPAGAFLCDLRSAGGTLVNGQPTQEAQLDDGVRIRIGGAEFCFEKLRDYALPELQRVKSAAADSAVEVPSEFSLVEEEVERLEGGGGPGTHAAGPAGVPTEYSVGDLQLTGLEGVAEGRTFPLDRPSMILGRERGADIAIHDLAISRRHALLTITDGKVEIQDLGSRNGIIINGHRVERAQLKVGDTIRIGTTLLLVDWLRGSRQG